MADKKKLPMDSDAKSRAGWAKESNSTEKKPSSPKNAKPKK